MDNSFNELVKDFENKINQINDTFEALKNINKSLVEKLKAEKENNKKIIDTYKKYETIESDIVKLNVGGNLYSTLKSTLTKKIKNPVTNEFYKPNILEAMLNGYIEPKYDENKAIFIDRNPKYFGYILDYLRMANTENEFELPDNLDKKELRKEAKFYNIEGLIDLTESKILKSSILKGNLVKDFFNLCGFVETEKWNLIYKASRDGFSSKDFHRKCDNIPRTLTIIKTTMGYIFGGYTEEAWESSGVYKSDSSAFLFSLVNKQDYPVKIRVSHGHEMFAIYCGSNCGPTFGGGHDLYVSDYSNVNNLSYTNLGHSYRHSQFIYGTTEANTFLADNYNFQCEEIEVFIRK